MIEVVSTPTFLDAILKMDGFQKTSDGSIMHWSLDETPWNGFEAEIEAKYFKLTIERMKNGKSPDFQTYQILASKVSYYDKNKCLIINRADVEAELTKIYRTDWSNDVL